ncbi:MAG: 4Fe-4S binding protein [Chloroflexi bacterium]|nr:4Fe-4S binding protein [Chloroflexota bacterium]
MSVLVNESLCKGCGVCVSACPAGAIYMMNGKALIDPQRCDACEKCIGACPTGALQRVEVIDTSPAKSIAVSPRPVASRSLARRPGWIATALAGFGYYLIPRIVDFFASGLERKSSTPQSRLTASARNDARRQRRRRQRGGRSGW